MAIFIVLQPYLSTTKLSCLQKNNFGHTKDAGKARGVEKNKRSFSRVTMSPCLSILSKLILLWLTLINTHVDSMTFWRIMKRFSKSWGHVRCPNQSCQVLFSILGPLRGPQSQNLGQSRFLASHQVTFNAKSPQIMNLNCPKIA